MNITPWGWHCIIDASNCDLELISSATNIEAFVRKLVIDIDMVAYGDPQIVNFGSGNKKGFTLVQLIETSNICAHFADEDRAAYLDVFSCKRFDPDVVKRCVQQFFCPSYIDVRFLIRNA